MSAAAHMEKNRATNIITAPAAGCLPIAVKAFIQPLQNTIQYGQ
jgi:hypothetical protein